MGSPFKHLQHVLDRVVRAPSDQIHTLFESVLFPPPKKRILELIFLVIQVNPAKTPWVICVGSFVFFLITLCSTTPNKAAHHHNDWRLRGPGEV